jgi:hypothetical protein
MAEMGLHIPQTNDLVAQMTLGRAAPVDQLMWRKAREHNLGVIKVRVSVALLWHEKMTELAKDQLPRTHSGSMLCQRWQPFRANVATRTCIFLMKDGIVSALAGGIVPMGRVMGAVPMTLPLGRSLLEDVAALGAEHIVAETEVLMQNQCPLRYPLLAVLTLYITRLVRFGFGFSLCLGMGGICCDPEIILHRWLWF